MSKSLCFLKLGGSLITDKTVPRTVRLATIERLAAEIKTVLLDDHNLSLVLGHGSGSFGHVPAKQYSTRQGVKTVAEWQGFAEVWYEAASLNRFVIEALHAAGLPAVAFPASAALTAQDGAVLGWDLTPLKSALANKLLPVVYGDVVFDTARGGTIFSTEDLFTYLARNLTPRRILLAGIDEGVWSDFPTCTQLIEEITPGTWPEIESSLGGSSATDVTGGMASKAALMLSLSQEIPGLEVQIFNGAQPGNLSKALCGSPIGTRIAGEN